MNPPVVMLPFCLLGCASFIVFTQAAICPENCECLGTVIDCKSTSLDHIPIDLPNPESIKEMYFQQNNIKTILDELRSYTNLEILNLENNGINDIHDDAFTDLWNLTELRLGNNKLSSFPRQLFIGLQLHTLDLSNNYLANIPSGAFSIPSLQELSLSGNSRVLSTSNDDVFAGGNSIRTLNLQSTWLDSVPTKQLQRLTQLRSLSLNINGISKIGRYAFRKNGFLEEISIENNYISEVDNLAFATMAGVNELKILRLSSNKLSNIPTAIKSLGNLQELHLNINPMEEIPANSFDGMRYLQRLQLMYMSQLKVVKKNAFAGLVNLKEIYLHSCSKLTSIEPGAFGEVPPPYLRKVYFNNNHLSSLDKNLITWDNLRELDVSNNFYDCSCNATWMPEMLRHQKSKFSQTHGQKILCFSPESMRYKKLIQLHDGSFECNKEAEESTHGILIGLGIFVGILAIVMVTALVYRFRRRIRSGLPITSVYKTYHNSDAETTHHVNSDEQNTKQEVDEEMPLQHDDNLDLTLAEEETSLQNLDAGYASKSET